MNHETLLKKDRFHASGSRLHDAGFSLLEAIVVLGLLAVLMAGLAQLNLAFTKKTASQNLTLRANAIAAETLESLRLLKESDWHNLSDLSLNTNYYLSFSDSTKLWSVLSSNPGNIDGIYSRSFVLKEVRRGAAGEIVSSGGSADSKTFLAEANISWVERGENKGFKLSAYLADF